MSLVYTAPVATTGVRRNSVYIGGRADAKSLEKLERWGISHILNVSPPKEAAIQAGVPNFFEKSRRFVYKRIPVYDASTSAPQLESQAEEIASFISKGLFHGSVLVHCQHGVSRSTTCVVMYLMRKVELSLEDAMALSQRRRPNAKPIPAFVQMLERYETKCLERRVLSEGGSVKKKRKMMGPSIGPPAKGPSIGPSIGPTVSIGPSIGPLVPLKTSIGPSIGPARPETIGPSIGPSVGPSNIGPATSPPPSAAITKTGNQMIGSQMAPGKESSSAGSGNALVELPAPKPSNSCEATTTGPSVPPTSKDE